MLVTKLLVSCAVFTPRQHYNVATSVTIGVWLHRLEFSILHSLRSASDLPVLGSFLVSASSHHRRLRGPSSAYSSR